MIRSGCLFAVMGCTAFALPVQAQKPQPAGAQLPVSRIILFSSGVGYFQRDGQVDGNARIELQFHSSDINDLLKSLILQDRDGGHIGTVGYDNRDPIEKTLRTFAIDLTGSPSLGQLMAQLRGERVEIQARRARPTPLRGIIVGVEWMRGASATDNAASLRAALSKTVSLATGIEANTPLKDVLELLQRLSGVTIVADSQAFRSDMSVDAVEEQPIKLPKMKRVSLATILRLMADQVNGSYRIGADTIEITTKQRAAAQMKSETVEPLADGAGAVAETLNLLTDGGLESIALDKMERLHFSNPELDKEFRQALELIAHAKDKKKKAVSINFLGNGKRRVKIGYVTENPIWKTTYRLAVAKDDKPNKAFLQGWAIVENTTDEDWDGVSLALVSGRPISFAMDLYEPLYLSRPVFEPELFASLRPQTYEGSIDQMEREQRRETKRGGMGAGLVAGLGGLAVGAGLGRAPATGPMNPAGQQQGVDDEMERTRALPFDLSQGIASAGFGARSGQSFCYRIERPVSLARQKSALLPIVNQEVEAAKVSIYNHSVHPSYPLCGFRLKNSTGLHLMQGPITVFDNDSYAGDAIIADLQPNETRLISYALDLGTEVVAEGGEPVSSLVSVKLNKGVLEKSHQLRRTKQYTIKNRSERSRLVLVEQPVVPGWNLVKSEGSVERSRDAYQFAVQTEPGKASRLEVVEESTSVEVFPLKSTPDATIVLSLGTGILSNKVRAGLEEAIALRRKLADTSEAIQAEEGRLDLVEKDQARMRANMERVPQASEAYKRYLKKLDEQETAIESRYAQLLKLREALAAERKLCEAFVTNLSAE
jgi:hypothetical protein